MTVKYGPWIAFNPGDTPPEDGVMVQPRFADDCRAQLSKRDADMAEIWYWGSDGDSSDIIAYRVAVEPSRGEVIYDGTLRTFYSLHAGLTAKCYDKEADHVHVTFTTEDGLLIPGTYSGPDGATIKIEVVK